MTATDLQSATARLLMEAAGPNPARDPIVALVATFDTEEALTTLAATIAVQISSKVPWTPRLHLTPTKPEAEAAALCEHAATNPDGLEHLLAGATVRELRAIVWAELSMWREACASAALLALGSHTGWTTPIPIVGRTTEPSRHRAHGGDVA